MTLSRELICAGVSAGALSVSVIGMMIWKHQQTRKKNKALDEEVATLEKELRDTEKHFEDEVHKIAFLMNVEHTMRILENQRELFKLELEDVQTEMEEKKNKLQSLEKKIAECEERKETDKTEQHLREKQRRLNAVWRLEKRKEDLEKLQLNTDKQLQSKGAEDIMILIERIIKLKNDMKHLNEQLEKINREKLNQSFCLF